MDFFKNISRLGIGNMGVDLFVGLMEKFVDSLYFWNVNYLLKFLRLFSKDEVNVVVDVYYALFFVVRFLKRVVDKNVTEVFKDVYNFIFFYGISILNVIKEDFVVVIKIFSDIIELILERLGIFLEVLTCFFVVWCWNYIIFGF